MRGRIATRFKTVVPALIRVSTKEEDYTPWMRGDQYTPARPGWYQVRMNPRLQPHPRSNLFLTNCHPTSRRYWDGSRWCAGWIGTGAEGTSIFGLHPSHEWRGLKLRVYAKAAGYRNITDLRLAAA